MPQKQPVSEITPEEREIEEKRKAIEKAEAFVKAKKANAAAPRSANSGGRQSGAGIGGNPHGTKPPMGVRRTQDLSELNELE